MDPPGYSPNEVPQMQQHQQQQQKIKLKKKHKHHQQQPPPPPPLPLLSPTTTSAYHNDGSSFDSMMLQLDTVDAINQLILDTDSENDDDDLSSHDSSEITDKDLPLEITTNKPLHVGPLDNIPSPISSHHHPLLPLSSPLSLLRKKKKKKMTKQQQKQETQSSSLLLPLSPDGYVTPNMMMTTMSQ